MTRDALVLHFGSFACGAWSTAAAEVMVRRGGSHSLPKLPSAKPLLQDSVVRGFRPESTAAGAGGENGCPKVAVGFESAADMVSAEADGHCSGVNALAVCGGCVCSAGSDAMIRCWRVGSLQSVRCARAALQVPCQPSACHACS